MTKKLAKTKNEASDLLAQLIKSILKKQYELKIEEKKLSISLNMFWMLKRTVSLRMVLLSTTYMFWLRNKKNIFQILSYLEI